ncbi:MAG: ATP-binding protein, partial [Verrucomicrobiota bacterium]
PVGWVVRLNSTLPPLPELAEGVWDENMRSEAARRKMFVRLLRSESQLENLVNRWPGVIFSQRSDLSFHFVSPQIEGITGVRASEWLNQRNLFWEVVHESDIDELKKQIKLATRTPEGITTTYRIRNVVTGRVAYVLEHRQAVMTKGGLVLGYEGVWLDVTRQTIAEKRLSSAAWKETLAVLTMGLAHDFSNMMAGIHSISESFLAQIGVENSFYEGMSLIRQNSLQASQLVQRIINLHHGKTGERNYHDLNEIVGSLVELGRKIIPRRIKIAIELTPDSLPLYVDLVEFHQVIINLILNAADAMLQKGTLLFRTSRHEEFPDLANVQGTLPRLPSACLAIQDDGSGIPARHLSSIFDPFFTTKTVDKGSGLGLYNAKLFVEKHRGSISVDSIEGAGTTFRIWLPISDFTEGERDLESALGKRSSILLVGRAGKPLENAIEFLRLNGYQVVVANSEGQAKELLGGNEYPFVGLLVLLEGNDPEFSLLLADARVTHPSLKTVMQTIGCNQDELSPDLLKCVDLVISSDMSQEAVLGKLSSIL